MDNDFNAEDLRDKIMAGIHLAVKRLHETAKKNNQVLVISQNGKIKRVKAREL